MTFRLFPTDEPTFPVVDACDLGVVHGHARGAAEAVGIYLDRFHPVDRPARAEVDCEFSDGKYRLCVVRRAAA